MPDVRLTDLIDVLIVAVLLFTALGWVRHARGRIALAGVAIAGALFLVARALGLQMTVWILQGFFAVGVLVLVVVFQDDLRRGLEQLAVWGLRRRPQAAPADAVDALVGAVRRMAAARIGALVVLAGREPLDRHVAGGIELDGKLSEPLLLSLFDPHSAGHDGAVLVEGDRVRRFALHLPLSTDGEQLGGGGTRHAAALGLAERSDAFCVVVSEERGTVSVARDGSLHRLPGPEALASELRRFLQRVSKRPDDRGALRAVARRWPEALVALGASLAFWFLLVPGSVVDRFARRVPVVVDNLPPGWTLESVEPSEVEVVFEGPRRSLLFSGGGSEAEVHVDALLVQLGRRTFEIDPGDVRHPEGWRPLAVEPDRVKLSLAGNGGTRAGGK
ncbi:MAG: diadenylate cyclase [Deltaproteobacteria bacterium]|nr:diadenylate cyclase [Deltaproteobacteria bacterium]